MMLKGEYAAKEAARLLSEGHCVAIPTETVYGLAAKATDPQAIAKIYEAKGRPRNHPLIVHIAEAKDVALWARDVPEDLQKLASSFWPGPLTLVLKKALTVPDEISQGQDTIALRVPSHPTFHAILRELGSAVVAPSANPHKRLSPVTAEQVMDGLEGRIAAVVDGGRCELGLESTILDLTRDLPCILRKGPISRIELERTLGKKVVQPTQHSVRVAGNMKAHYQPKAKVRVLSYVALKSLMEVSDDPKTICLVYSDEAIRQAAIFGVRHQLMPKDARSYGRELYHSLAMADKSDCDYILVEAPPQDEDWLAVNDRLLRAEG